MSKLTNAPVVYTLCQVRFSPVLKIGDYIPEIQERHRKAYPRFHEQQVQTFQIIADGSMPKAEFTKRWAFADKRNRTGFLIFPDSISFHTTEYDTFDSFLDSFSNILESMGEIAGVGLVERVGLRFIDLVVATPELSLEKLIQNQLVGFHMEQATPIFQQHDTLSETPIGQMRFRLTRAVHQSPLPPDLQSLLAINVTAPAEQSIVLDTDHFNEEIRDFVVADVAELIDNLHQYTGTAFRSAVTEEALQAWA